uniref:Uncharacterized protein n=1 Tax=Aegilops tauschii subsp. strangulata TaxID=200361 RepID=A0A453K312_AEGTS
MFLVRSFKRVELVRIMRKRLVRKAFDMILGISCSENRDDYEAFWENYGKFLKLGCMEDKENHKRIAPLLRFFSSQSNEELISLDEYVESMKPEQKAIYYIAGDSLSSAKNAPFLEKLNEMGYEVLLLIDPMDEVSLTNLNSYKDKSFVDISKEDLDLGMHVNIRTLFLNILLLLTELNFENRSCGAYSILM